VLTCGVLGGVWAELDGLPVPLGGPRQRAVLAALMAARGGVLTPDQLVDAVWETDPPGTAVATLQTYISNLRKLLEPGRSARDVPSVIITVDAGYVMRIEPDAVDAWRFERAVHPVGAGPQTAGSPARRAELEGALSEWRGEPFAGLPRAAWVEAEAVRLRELHWSASEELARVLLDSGDLAAAEARAATVTSGAPLRESAWCLLAVAQYAAGRPGTALASLRRARDVLAREAGIAPGAELRELEQRMLRREVVLPARDAGPDTDTDTDSDTP